MFEQPTATFDRRHRSFFGDSEDARQVWALDSTRGKVVYLPDGAVDDEVRLACRQGRLRCPVAHCPDPRLIAKGGAERRHHFAHKVADTRHDSAAIFRTEALAMLAGWARRYRGAQVSTRHVDAVGIVRIRSAVSGRVGELAVTYDPRYEPGVALASPAPQLLVGHTRALLLPRAEHPRLPGAWCCGDPRLVGELIDQHGAALAANPERRLVATLVATRVAEQAGLVPRNATSYPTICLSDDIDACRLEGDGTLSTPTLRALRAWQDSHSAAALHRRPRRARRRTGRGREHGVPSPGPQSDPHIDLPVAAICAAREDHHDINRVVLSGRLLRDARPDNDPDQGDAWNLAVACDTGQPSAAVEVVVSDAVRPTAPAPDAYVIVHGRLASREVTGAVVVLADTLELYRSVKAASTRPAR